MIIDFFGGSGSMLIACEQLGRKCYMGEIDPKYCDVILLLAGDIQAAIKGLNKLLERD